MSTPDLTGSYFIISSCRNPAPPYQGQIDSHRFAAERRFGNKIRQGVEKTGDVLFIQAYPREKTASFSLQTTDFSFFIERFMIKLL